MKLIVTHRSVDLDAITSTWLVKRFLPGFENAEIKFVPAQTNFQNILPDSNKDVVYVDTGHGKFDHHQTNDNTCAALRVFMYLQKHKLLKSKDEEALERLVNVVNDIDHFRESSYPDPTADRYDFMLSQILEGLKSQMRTDLKIIEHIFPCLESILQIIKNKINAEREIKKGYVFKAGKFRCLAMSCRNEETIKLALKQGFDIVVRKDPVKKHVRIKAHPLNKVDLTPIYNNLIKIDNVGTWFLHVSKKMLLNGSSKNPTLKPTPLSLQKVIEIIKSSLKTT